MICPVEFNYATYPRGAKVVAEGKSRIQIDSSLCDTPCRVLLFNIPIGPEVGGATKLKRHLDEFFRNTP